MKQYHEYLQSILENGTFKPAARKGMPGSISLFGPQMEFNLSEGFPILTTKKVSFKNIFVELLWFLRGDTNVRFLNIFKCKIWNEDAYNYYVKQCEINKIVPLEFDNFIEKVVNNEDCLYLSNYKYGDCGFQYGKTWRGLKVDQIERALNGLLVSPESRRHVVSSIDIENDTDLALYWCHSMFQFNARPIEKELITEDGPKYYLDCKMYQRSADSFLGTPYNLSSYSLLTALFAKICNMIPGKFIHSFGDAHIYDNHLDQTKEILKRDYNKYALPVLKFSENFEYLLSKFLKSDLSLDGFIFSLDVNDIYLEDYQSYDSIKAKLSTGLK